MIRHCLLLAAALLALGCGGPAKQANPKVDPYRVKGRVVDAATGEPIPQARIRFQAKLRTLPGVGPGMLTAMERAGPDGTYQVQIGAGYDALRAAEQIRIDAGAEGYAVSGVDLPPPTEKKPVYAAADIKLSKAPPKPPRPRPTRTPARRPAPGPLPWKSDERAK